MAKISMLIPEEQLAQIDREAGGNRTSFMIAAAVDRARDLERARLDQEIARSVSEDAESDLALYRDWEITMADGLGQ